MNSSDFTLDKAIQIATKAHEGQIDKSGSPYINHPLNVMNQLQGKIPKIIGVLHDVVEDTDMTFEDLESEGCLPEVIDALKLVTHPEGFENTEENYLKWITEIKNSGNQTAIDVKWADLTHNCDLGRIKEPSEKDLARLEKYKKAKVILKPVISKYLLV